MGISRGRDHQAPPHRSIIKLPHSAHIMVAVTNHKEISMHSIQRLQKRQWVCMLISVYSGWNGLEIVGVEWPAVLSPWCLDFLALMNCPLELWARINPFFTSRTSCLCQEYFLTATGKETRPVWKLRTVCSLHTSNLFSFHFSCSYEKDMKQTWNWEDMFFQKWTGKPN